MEQPCGIVASVQAGSPAELAGVAPGDRVLRADGHVLHDVIDWRWWADGESVELDVARGNEAPFAVELQREPGQDWGIEFSDVLFDGVMPCCNDCTFCFMKMLPADARASLMERDDDYRLSFTQGNFVTFTNLSDKHVQRIIEQHLSPLRFSLHASDPAVRESMIGKAAWRGLEVADELLEAGIELHAQIVLVPGCNDGEVLRDTLSWAQARPGIANVGIVPVGYTRHQTRFERGFDTPEQARAVIDLIEPFREVARAQRGCAWVHASDEFYRVAYGSALVERIPPAADYGAFELYEDGIGMVRSYIDDWRCAAAEQDELAELLSGAPVPGASRILSISGEATREFVDPLLAESPLVGLVVPLHVRNDYFGGNVDVTGLLCGCDIGRAIAAHIARDEAGYAFAVAPNSILNSDGVTLDGMTLPEVSEVAGIQMHVVSCQPSESLSDMVQIARSTLSGGASASGNASAADVAEPGR